MKFLNNLSIKLKISAGFGLMQAIIVMISVSALVSLLAVQDKVNVITTDIQPAVLLGNKLAINLEKSNSALGFYLLSKEDIHKQAYLNSLQTVDAVITDFRAMPMVQGDADITAQLDSIVGDVERFKGYQERMLHLATNAADNIPATKYTAQNLSPRAQRLLQFVSGMIQSESDEEATPKRRKILLALGKLRYNWTSIMNGLRGYLSFRQQSALDEIKLYRESLEGTLKTIQEFKDDLTLDQSDALEQFIPLKDEFFVHLEKVIEIHGGEAWRTDAHLIRTEVGPLLQGVDAKVSALVGGLNGRIGQTGAALESEVSSTNTLVTTLLILGLVLGGVIAWGIKKVIVSPLQTALDAMADIVGGEGDLTRRLDDSSKDEIGQLANGFNMFASVVHHIIKEILGYTEQLTHSADRLTVITEETSRGADRQQTQTDEVVAAVNELAATGQEVRQFQGCTASVLAASFSPDARFIVTASHDVVTPTDSPKAYRPVVLAHAGNRILLKAIRTNTLYFFSMI